MKAKINGIEFEGTPFEFRELMDNPIQAPAPIRATKTKPNKAGINRKNMSWTDEECKTLIELYNQGKSPKYIGRFLGRTPSSITTQKYNLLSKLHPVALPVALKRECHNRKKWSATEDETLVKEYRMGNSIPNIAKLLNRKRHAVNCRLSLLRQKSTFKFSEKRRSKKLVDVGYDTKMPKKTSKRQVIWGETNESKNRLHDN